MFVLFTGLPKFSYGEHVEITLPLRAVMSDFQCYKCGAWEYQEDFERTLHACLNNPYSSSIETCPSEIGGIKLKPSCGVSFHLLLKKHTSRPHILITHNITFIC